MTNAVLFIVLCAALLHALWNAAIKLPGDSLVRLALINLTAGLCSASLLPFLGMPDPASWPYLAGSILVHTVYYIGLLGGYRDGELSLVYPIARGIAPALVAAGAFLHNGETLTPLGNAGVLLVCVGIISLAFSGTGFTASIKPVLYALLTGVSIAAYTVLDGTGGRLSNNVFAYIAWLFFLDSLPLFLFVSWARQGQMLTAIRQSWRAGLVGGVFALCAYGLVIWAMSKAPMSQVSAVRESSVIFATLIGVFYFNEGLIRRRILSSILVVCGIIIMQSANG